MAKRPTIAAAKGVSSITMPIDGEPRKLALKVTLGAMAELEDAFDCDFADLELHLNSTRNLAKFIGALARAAGEDLSDEQIEQIRRAPIGIDELMAAITSATDTGAPKDAPKEGAETPAKN